MFLLDSLHSDSESRRKDPVSQVVHEFRWWREAETDWRSSCSGDRQGCQAHKFCWGIVATLVQRKLFLKFKRFLIDSVLWIPQFRNFKIIYRRYAGLYFCICVDINDNNLCYLEAIHNFVEVLNEYFHNVCELDLVFNFYKASNCSILSHSWIYSLFLFPIGLHCCWWDVPCWGDPWDKPDKGLEATSHAQFAGVVKQNRNNSSHCFNVPICPVSRFQCICCQINVFTRARVYSHLRPKQNEIMEKRERKKMHSADLQKKYTTHAIIKLERDKLLDISGYSI